ncbi:DNA internalization-related competence protein ComEC/Rec2 [Gracilibacillus xinjiangensis]|uniref:DNA internalization-related competence protein ComEC/Rec2 n=1 Tax=Gracilibacillus xinjiangensis TaxID=1193282 RepID=A0ABV8X141_9BACI
MVLVIGHLWHWYVIVYVIAIFIKGNGDYWLCLLTGSTVIYFIAAKRWSISFSFSILIVFLIGWFHNAAPNNLPPDQLTSLTNLQGTITSDLTLTDNSYSFDFKVRETVIKVYYFFDEEENTYEHIKSFQHGSFCTLHGTFQSDTNATNPGQFNYQEFLKKQGFSGQFVIADTNQANCEGSSFVQQLYNFRNTLLEKLNNNTDHFTMSWMKALLFGDRNLLPDETVKLFQNWGLSHLLAISGLHVGLLLTCLYFFGLYMVRMTKEQIQGIIVTILPIYPVIAGSAPSVWRASILALFLIVLRKWRIPLQTSSVLSLVFLAMTLADPYIVHSLAFQFSFLVTYSILFSKKIAADNIGNGWIILRISMISMLVILPLQINAFYQFQPLSILLNVIVIPYFSLFVLPFLLLICCSLMVPQFLPILNYIFHSIHHHFLVLLSTMDQLISNTWTVGSLPAPYIMIYYLILLCFFILLEKERELEAFLMGTLLVGSLMIISIFPYLDSNGRITILDIGQGDAIIVELPHRSNVFLIDAGGRMNKDYSSATSSVYEQIIRPYLHSRGISKLDAIIASHGDNDHIGSFPFIVKDFQVNYLITSAFFNEQYVKDYNQLNRRMIHQPTKAGSEIIMGNHKLKVLHPYKDMEDTNENSLVLYAKFGGLSWLFTGDIGEESEVELLNNYPKLQVDVLKVAHHGSDTSTSEEFLLETQPLISIISVGRRNRYGHPSADVVDRLESSSNIVLRTDEHGAVTYIFNNKSGTFSTYFPYDAVNNTKGNVQ